MKYIIFIFLLLAFWFCKESSDKSQDGFARVVSLKHTVRNPQIEAWWPDHPLIVDSVLVIASWKLEEGMFHFFL